MKYYWILAGLVLLSLSLFGVVKSFTSPLEISTLKSIKVLEFQQEGAFDYQVTAKPVYFYNNAQLSASETTPQIPFKFIENISLNYSYTSKSGGTGDTLKVNAILESPGVWKKTVNLVPAQSNSTSIAIPLDLQYFLDLAETIEKEIGISASAHDLTIQSVVSGQTGQDFIQLLTIKLDKTYVKINGNLVSSGGGREGRFEYAVKLGDNSLYGPITIKSPIAPETVQSVVLGLQDTIFTKFIESMNITYNYHLSSTQAIGETQTGVIVEAILENPKTWTKTYTLVPPSNQKGDVNLNFPLELEQFNTIFDTIQKETGITASNQNLTIKATLHSVAQTDQGSIDKTFSQSITTDLRDSLLIWNGELKKNSPGSIDISRSVSEKSKLWRLPVIWVRILTSVLSILILAALFFYVNRSRRRPIYTDNCTTGDWINQYKDIVINVQEWPDARSGQTVLSVESPQTLIKVARGLLKPVNHATLDGDHVYWVNDELTRYELRTSKTTSLDSDTEGN